MRTSRTAAAGAGWLAAALGLVLVLSPGPTTALGAQAQTSVVRVPADVLGDAGIRDLDGRVWRSPDVAGRIVLVDAWATWCAPCLAELPRLRGLVTRHDDALVVLGLNLDTMPRRDFVSWLQRHDVAWPQLFDGRGYGGPAASRLGLDAIPASWIFDRRGRLVARNLRGAALDEAIDALVADEAGR